MGKLRGGGRVCKLPNFPNRPQKGGTEQQPSKKAHHVYKTQAGQATWEENIQTPLFLKGKPDQQLEGSTTLDFGNSLRERGGEVRCNQKRGGGHPSCRSKVSVADLVPRRSWVEGGKSKKKCRGGRGVHVPPHRTREKGVTEQNGI